MASRGAFEDKNKGMISQDRVEEERLLTGGQLNYVCLPSISVRLPGVFTVPFLPAVIRAAGRGASCSYSFSVVFSLFLCCCCLHSHFCSELG